VLKEDANAKVYNGRQLQRRRIDLMTMPFPPDAGRKPLANTSVTPEFRIIIYYLRPLNAAENRVLLSYQAINAMRWTVIAALDLYRWNVLE